MSENNKDTDKNEEAVVAKSEPVPSTESTASAALGTAAKSIDSLKKLDPKIQIAIGVGVLVFGWLIFSPSGDSGQQTIVDTQKGQSYIVENPNGNTVKLTKAPGVSGGMTDSAEDEGIDDSIVCLVKGGPHGIVEDITLGGLGLRFVKVKITEGTCKDKSGWISAINLHE